MPATEEWAVASGKLWRMYAPPAAVTASGTSAGRHSSLSGGEGILSGSAGSSTASRAGGVGGGLSFYRRSAVLSPGPVFTHCLSPLPANHAHLRTLTVVSNGDGMLGTLIGCVERVETLMHVGAYLHWYERFGVSKEHLRIASEAVLNTVDSYIGATGSGGAF